MLSLMNRRSMILMLCIIVLMILGILAASLHDVQFAPGRSLAAAARSQTPFSFSPLEIRSDTPVWKILLLWLAFVANLIIFFFLLPPEARKRILRQLVSFSVGLLVLLLALRYRVLQLPELAANPAEPAGAGVSQLAGGASIEPFQRPTLAPWIIYAVSLAALWVVFIVAWVTYRWWRRSQVDRGPSLAAIGGIARSSLDELASGRPWRDVVIEAYTRMSETVRVRRGLQRGTSTTAREFAARLTQAGLPSESVVGLTHLFETVRYGDRTPTERDMRAAVVCLELIVQACGAEA